MLQVLLLCAGKDSRISYVRGSTPKVLAPERHINTIVGGMLCTIDPEDYKYFRMTRSHGMLREVTDQNA